MASGNGQKTRNDSKTTPAPQPAASQTGSQLDLDALFGRMADTDGANGRHSLDQSSLEQAWARRAAQIAKAEEAPDQSEQMRLTLVRLDDEIYGFDVQYIFDIRLSRGVTPIPRVPAWVKGVVNIRGRILSVVDLYGFMGLKASGLNTSGLKTSDLKTGQESPDTQGQYLIVVETPSMEVALLVSDVLGVEEMSTERIQEATTTIPGIHSEYVLGITDFMESDQRRPVVVLDLPALLSDPRLVIHEDIL